SGSGRYTSSGAKTTPDVPSTTESTPGRTAPTPTAPACWSPAPPVAVDSFTGGSHSPGIPSASQTSSLHRRPATSKSSVPDSSAARATTSPVGDRASALTPVVPTSTPTSASGTQRGVDELVRAHRVLAGLRVPQRRVVDAPGNPVDEAPLQHRALDRGDRVLGIRVEVEAEALALFAVARP